MSLLSPSQTSLLSPSIRFSIILASLAFVGAGCFGGSSSSGGADGGVFKTSDAGEEWTQQAAILSAKGIGSIGSADMMTLEMDPQDNQTVYAGTAKNGLIYSTDAAASWQQVRATGLKEGTVGAVEVDPTNVCTVYVAKGARLYKTDDCGRSFSSEAYVETRAGVTITKVVVDWYNPLIVWIGLSNGDILKSEDASVTWQTSLAAKDSISGMMVSNADSRVILVATESDGFFKTTDGGASWTQIKDELKELRNAAKVTFVVQDATGATVLASTGYGLIRSKDFGSTWETLQLLSSPGQVEIRSVGIDPDDANVIVYAAGSTFYRSVDGGLKWTTSTIPSTRAPMAVLVDPTDAGVVYLGVATVEK